MMRAEVYVRGAGVKVSYIRCSLAVVVDWPRLFGVDRNCEELRPAELIFSFV